MITRLQAPPLQQKLGVCSRTGCSPKWRWHSASTAMRPIPRPAASAGLRQPLRAAGAVHAGRCSDPAARSAMQRGTAWYSPALPFGTHRRWTTRWQRPGRRSALQVTHMHGESVSPPPRRMRGCSASSYKLRPHGARRQHDTSPAPGRRPARRPDGLTHARHAGSQVCIRPCLGKPRAGRAGTHPWG